MAQSGRGRIMVIYFNRIKGSLLTFENFFLVEENFHFFNS